MNEAAFVEFVEAQRSPHMAEDIFDWICNEVPQGELPLSWQGALREWLSGDAPFAIRLAGMLLEERRVAPEFYDLLVALAQKQHPSGAHYTPHSRQICRYLALKALWQGNFPGLRHFAQQRVTVETDPDVQELLAHVLQKGG